jgi:hypothetical protein
MSAVILFVFSVTFAVDPEKKVPLTFLDTLNKGNELAISVPERAPQPPDVAPAAATGGEASEPVVGEMKRDEQRETGIVPSRFTVQVLASSLEQQVRQEKRTVSAKVKFPVSMGFDAPYYKLFVGDFAERGEAENVLAQIKKMGYNDAWIVRVAAPKR